MGASAHVTWLRSTSDGEDLFGDRARSAARDVAGVVTDVRHGREMRTVPSWIARHRRAVFVADEQVSVDGLARLDEIARPILLRQHATAVLMTATALHHTVAAGADIFGVQVLLSHEQVVPVLPAVMRAAGFSIVVPDEEGTAVASDGDEWSLVVDPSGETGSSPTTVVQPTDDQLLTAMPGLLLGVAGGAFPCPRSLGSASMALADAMLNGTTNRPADLAMRLGAAVCAPTSQDSV